MMYKLGLYEKSMPMGLSWDQMMNAGKAAGFDQLEISIDETDARLSRLEWPLIKRSELAKAGMETGLPVRTMCLSGHRRFPLGSRDPKTRERGMGIMRKAVRFSADVGIRLIQLAGYDVYYEEGGEDTRAWFAENLQKCVEYAAHFGVVLGFETMETPFMDTISKGMEFVKAVDSPYLGMYPDLGNLTNACFLYGLSVDDEISCGKGHTFAMHLKETDEGRYRDMSFGDGRVDFAGGIRQAMKCGVNIFTAEFWHCGGRDWFERLKCANAFLRDRFDAAI